MAYYNCEGKKLRLNLDKMEYLNSGNCALVIHDSNIIFKEYFSKTIMRNRITPNLFDILKNLNNSHFVELYDYYIKCSSLDLKSRLEDEILKIDAYTAKYYDDNSVNILFENKDYILDNFSELELLFDSFSSNEIIVNDMRRKNSILGKNGIVVIDPDLFVSYKDLRKSFGDEFYYKVKRNFLLSIENKKELLLLYKDLILSAMKSMGYNLDTDDSFASLYDIEVDENTIVVDEISKRLKNVKKPIDIVRR